MNDDQPSYKYLPISEREKIAGRAGIARARERLRNLGTRRDEPELDEETGDS